MSNKLLLFLLVVLFAAVAWYEGVPARVATWFASDNRIAGLLERVKPEGGLPGPLRGPFQQGSSQLSVSGVVTWTNTNRAQNNLPALRQNATLYLAAQNKLQDMFRQQYFEHESPDGKQPADVIKQAGYSYLVVGENLALGNFKDDEALVTAWMNSPGHRANILDAKYQEIGVAVGKGMFEGKEVWLAVQEFGTPLSACPSASTDVKRQIELNKAQIEVETAALEQKRSQLDRSRYQTQQAYEQAVAEYNQRVNSLNTLINETKSLVNSYNAQVGSFNQCLESNG